MNGYAILARSARRGRERFLGVLDDSPKLRQVIPAVAGAAVGFFAWPAHPVLGALGGSTVARSAVGLFTGDVTGKQAVRSVGAHMIATVGALSLPSYPALGYVAGAIASGVLIADPGGDETLIARDVLVGDAIPSVDDGATYNNDHVTVLAVQQQLLARDLYLPPNKLDGLYGPATAKGVRVVQKSIGVPATGNIDRAVLMALNVEVPAKADLPSDGRPAKGWSQPQPDKMGPAVVPEGDAAPAAESSFLTRPLWNGAPVNVWQAGLGGIGLAALAAGIIMAVR